jgi:Tol biopolymer transport system component
MTDLRTRLRDVERTAPPDLWLDISHREPKHDPLRATPSGRQRALVAALAVAVVGASIGFAVAAFHRGPTNGSVAPSPAVPENGEIAFVTSGIDTQFISFVRPDGTGLRDLTSPGGHVIEGRFQGLAWSPDGTTLAFSLRPAFTGGASFDVWTVHADGTRLTQVTRDAGDEVDPTWSPDGTMIAFAGFAGVGIDGARFGDRIYTVNADGSNERVRSDVASSDRDPAWSPVGASTLAFVRSVDGVDRIFTMDLNGAGVRQLTFGPGGQSSPAWSPDGSRLAFVAASGGRTHPCSSWRRTV